MPTYPRSYSLKTYALAFAIVLSPAVLQVDSCSPGTGDATLSTLEVEAMGENRIAAFDSEQRSYDVWLPLGADTATYAPIPTTQTPRCRTICPRITTPEPSTPSTTATFRRAAARSCSMV